LCPIRILLIFKRTMPPSTSNASRVAVIDIGSNTIKSMVLEGPSPGTVIHTETLEVRMETDGGTDSPKLKTAALERGAQAVAHLCHHLRPFEVAALRVVATSAVREASNQADFSRRVEAVAGVAMDILSGEDEARGIAAAIAAEPWLRKGSFITGSDLGGGSLEMIAFQNDRLTFVKSFRVGAVRFLERWVPDPAEPISRDLLDRISDETVRQLRDPIAQAGLRNAEIHIATGGAFTIARALLAAQAKVPIEAYGPAITAAELDDLAVATGALSPEERTEHWNIPPGRADVFPVALAILKGLADALETPALTHSFANLRKGLALELLQNLSPLSHE